MEELEVSIGSRIRLAREKKELTQTYVAKKLHIATSTLSGYERGNRIPDAYILKSLCELLEVSPEYLLGYKPNDKMSDEQNGKPNDGGPIDLEPLLHEGNVTFKSIPLTEELCDILADFLERWIQRKAKQTK